MPNWCDNTLIVRADPSNLRELRKFAKVVMSKSDDEVELLVFDNLVPVPQDIKDSGDEYQWCVDNWGTKWDATNTFASEHTRIDGNGKTTIYSFITAWSPPEEWVKRVAKLFPTLEFTLEYNEPGIGFSGSFSICVEKEKIEENIKE